MLKYSSPFLEDMVGQTVEHICLVDVNPNPPYWNVANGRTQARNLLFILFFLQNLVII